MLRLNIFFTRWSLFGICLISAISLYSQSFVKKDSSSLIPFLSKVYYQSQPDRDTQLLDKLYHQHRIQSYGQIENHSGLNGTLGSSLVPTLFENNFYHRIALGRVINSSYFYNQNTIPYFALNKPLSELDFIFFGNGNEEFKGFLSQNLSRKINIGIGIRRTNNKGFFLNQENSHNNLYAYVVYDFKKIRSNLEFAFNELNIKESGGYQNDIYQDGTPPGQWLAANPRLALARNQLKNYQITWRNRYLITGTFPLQDSLLFIPKRANLYIDHKLQYYSDRQYYSDTINGISRPMYGILAGTGSAMNSLNLHTGLESDFRLHIEKKGFKFSAYQILSDQNIELGQRFGEYLKSYQYLNLGLGADISYQWKKNLLIEGLAYKSFLGYTEQDFYIKGKMTAHFFHFQAQAWSHYSHQMPLFNYNIIYTSGRDTNYLLNPTKTLETGGSIYSSKYKLKLRLQYFAIQDFTSIDSLQRSIQVANNFFQIYLFKDWSYKSLYLPMELFYQNSIFSRAMLRQTVAYRSRLFSDKNNMLVGAELSLNHAYSVAAYSSFFMQPIFQNSITQARVYPKVDVFATFKISRVHLSLVFDNFLSTYLKSGISYYENHPIAPSAFYLRMNWRFFE